MTPILRLARWLGPWSDESARPGSVQRTSISATTPEDRTVDAFVYRPRTPVRGAVVLCGGVHYNGPVDTRLDRFARILSHSGLITVVPFFRDFMDLKITPRVLDEARGTFDYVVAQVPEARGACSLFSISFGSLPALAVATDPGRAPRVPHTVLFGGYADWKSSLEFALTGRIGGLSAGASDPLNQPVIHITLGEAMGRDAEQQARLESAWLDYARATWGRLHYRRGLGIARVAERIASQLDERDREPFLRGCGVVPGGQQECMAALERASMDWLDPRPRLPEIRSSVTIVHGADDDVIPVVEADRLYEALSPVTDVERVVTGLFGHTGAERIGPGAIWDELRANARILAGLQRLGTQPQTHSSTG